MTLSDADYGLLVTRADEEQRAVAAMAALLVRDGLAGRVVPAWARKRDEQGGHVVGASVLPEPELPEDSSRLEGSLVESVPDEVPRKRDFLEDRFGPVGEKS